MVKTILTYNPFYLVLRWTICWNTFRQIGLAISGTPPEGKEGFVWEFVEVKSDLTTNIIKQSIVMMVTTVIVIVVKLTPGLMESLSAFLDRYDPITMGLITGWFVISFSAVRRIFIGDAILVTLLMLTCLSVVFALLGLDIYHSEPPVLREIGVGIIILAWAAIALYDNTDCLRAGLDEAALDYYKQAQKALPVSVVDREK